MPPGIGFINRTITIIVRMAFGLYINGKNSKIPILDYYAYKLLGVGQINKIVLYTDAGCDLDLEVLDAYGIKQFYPTTIINGKAYQGRLNLSPPEFYKMLETGVVPTTSGVNMGTIIAEFEPILQDPQNEIIYIAFSGELSSTFQSAYMARDNLDPERVTVIDSRSASVGQGLIVLRAGEMIAAGCSKEEIITEVNDFIRHIEHVFIVGNFEMLKRGGRVNPAVAVIGDLLNIKLIMQMTDGRITPLEKAHGLKKAKKRLLDIMEQRGGDISNQLIGICYSQDLEGALEIKHMIEQRFGVSKFVVSEIGAMIGAHVGAGTFSVFFRNNGKD